MASGIIREIPFAGDDPVGGNFFSRHEKFRTRISESRDHSAAVILLRSAANRLLDARRRLRAIALPRAATKLYSSLLSPARALAEAPRTP
jgi:hypothetical protein